MGDRLIRAQDEESREWWRALCRIADGETVAPMEPTTERFAGLGWNAVLGDRDNTPAHAAMIAESLRLQGEVLVQIRDLLAALVREQR